MIKTLHILQANLKILWQEIEQREAKYIRADIYAWQVTHTHRQVYINNINE